MPTRILTDTVPARGAPATPGLRQPRRAGEKACLSRVLAAFREGRALAFSPPSSGCTETQYAEQVRSYLQGRLRLADRDALERLSRPRETGLAMARDGRLHESEGFMKLARFALSVASLSPEARTVAESQYQAAASYLSYRRGDFADAYARMAAARHATDQLAGLWGESEFTEAHRVHLTHNMMKVEMRRGANREAMDLGESLLGHLSGMPGVVPFSRGSSPESRLDDKAVKCFLIAVTSTLAELLAPLPASEVKVLLGFPAWLPKLGASPFPRAREWLALRSNVLADDPRPFLEAAEPFLRAGRGEAPALWYAVALDVLRIHRALDPASGAVAEITVELSTGPAVPTRMRVPGYAA